MPFPVIMAKGTRKRDNWHIYKQVPPTAGYVDQGESLCGRHGLYGLNTPYNWDAAILFRENSPNGYCRDCYRRAKKAIA
jgi:hypothetical protein